MFSRQDGQAELGMGLRWRKEGENFYTRGRTEIRGIDDEMESERQKHKHGGRRVCVCECVLCVAMV